MDGGGNVLVAGTGIPLSDSDEGAIQKEKNGSVKVRDTRR